VAIALLNPNTDRLLNRMTRLFAEGKALPTSQTGSTEKEYNNGVWLASGFVWNPGDDYQVGVTATDLGLDRKMGGFFGGISYNNTVSVYTSDDADITAVNNGASLYGGMLLPLDIEAGFVAGLGGVQYYQDRKVKDAFNKASYNSEYMGLTWNMGLTLGRSFPVVDFLSIRPYLLYELAGVKTNAYDESSGVYALSFDSHTEAAHKLGGGMGVYADIIDNFLSASLRGWGLAIFGDRNGSPSASFVEDEEGNKFTSKSGAASPFVTGIDLTGYIALPHRLGLSLGYTLNIREEMVSHDGTLALNWSF
jgi:uncharacterized protein with beta-barrel porin domain